ncbi:MAG: family 78 glycoside hydrolase catalytic domain [Acutalibacteraceae bacterium]
MTHREIFGDARWLSPKGSPDAALFRGTFAAKQGEKAVLTICGLGYFIAYINGKRVGKDEFVPPYSDYHDRPDMCLLYPLNDDWNHRIYCMQYDVTQLLLEGENVLGVMVGGGFYHQLNRSAEGNMSYGDIKLCFKLEQGGQSFLSDSHIQCQTGFFKKSNLFYGETLDFTGFDRRWNTLSAAPQGWDEPQIVTAPKTQYYVADCPTDKVVERLTPMVVRRFADYTVYAVERNCTGYPVIRCEKSGETVTLECAEEIFEDGNINNESVGYGVQRQTATFVTDGEPLYHPYFCWFGFRYFSLSNNAEPVEVRVIHADVPPTSGFECSDETLNWYQKAFVNGQEGNMHGCVPSDCPHRERLGYTGDGQLTCDAVMTQFDAKRFYRKWIADIRDCQDPYTGHVQHTAPFAGGGGGPAGWGGAIISVPWIYYTHYGDKTLLAWMFPCMEKFAAYMESRCADGLVVREERDGWCLGDWCPPQKVEIPEPFVNTAMYIAQLEMLCKTAEVLGKDDSRFKQWITAHQEALREKYFDPETNSFLRGIQGADAFALSCGIGNEITAENLAAKYTALGEFDTGMFGTYILLDELYKHGYGDLATALLANKKTVSYETMRRAGATTIWENWNGESSHNHPMFGASTLYLYKYILGIRPQDGSTCYDRVVIEPVFADCLGYAKGHITTPHGEISVDWKKENGKIAVTVSLCTGVDAVFRHGQMEQKLYPGVNKIII